MRLKWNERSVSQTEACSTFLSSSLHAVHVGEIVDSRRGGGFRSSSSYRSGYRSSYRSGYRSRTRSYRSASRYRASRWTISTIIEILCTIRRSYMWLVASGEAHGTQNMQQHLQQATQFMGWHAIEPATHTDRGTTGRVSYRYIWLRHVWLQSHVTHISSMFVDPNICRNVERYAVYDNGTVSKTEKMNYFVCPFDSDDDHDDIYCCGGEDSQTCCSYWQRYYLLPPSSESLHTDCVLTYSAGGAWWGPGVSL